ncbi:aminotransferase class IV [Paenibacillus polymyxa]|uniref:4-amino-4-deoxychorismate lyase n=1 Tax=Paenibacillus polymyxa (strain SC2) TaxID=886882 RepID=E3EDZ0_PAEPS|nr:aminotransferase class IV [Paenibacillus polymyxa]ADO54056.1 4-amino-4-deoxychorismate lyase [Paenibacillus polymyxa SC2]AJE51587.1 4-amino-4-deoxychorismate lyase [Paenibacillus polymyxa]QOH60002.1 4-amino-4-deoxychorismate lyase [Paenibacillus polymyxa]WPQ56998.1 aminotransferase class IV [Paenibacillus polymyxa]CCC83000.1 4-amino-4-deoxychorismate lyase [Paenibacillus polymyxa M1]
MRYIGVNGVLTEAAKAVIHVSDHGFLYGMGLFETFRTYKGVPFLLDRHLHRLEEGCRMLGIPFQPDEEQLTKHIQHLMAANGLNEAYIRYTVSAGEEALGLPSGDYTRPNHILFAKPLPSINTQPGQSSALQLLRTPRNTPEGEVRLKSLHYMNNVLAKRELQQYAEAVRYKAEGIMLTANGFLAEGIVSNLFFVRNNTLYTPDLSTGILPGITREFILELADLRGIPWEQGLYHWYELKQADEIFMTNSIQEIRPVDLLLEPGEVASHLSVPLAQTESITALLLHDYRQKAGMK